MAAKKPKHAWKFFRAGGVDQVDITSGSDVESLVELDKKLWVALACPTRGMKIEARTLQLIDTDGDGRIRPPEILGAIAWAKDVFRNLDDLIEGGDGVPIASINDKTPAGRDLLAGAKRILTNLGLEKGETVNLAHVADTEKVFAETRFNGDGIVPVASAGDDQTRRAIEDVIAVVGSVVDRGGKPGVDAARVDAFFTRATKWTEWLDRADAEKSIRPFGEGTAAAAEALAAVRAKVDDYFVRCNLGAFDERMGAQLGPDVATAELSGRDLATDDVSVARMPLSHPEPGRALPLRGGINPAWATRVATFVDAAVIPTFGADKASLAEADFASIVDRLSPWQAWRATKPADPEVEKLGDARVRELARGNAAKAIQELIAQDAALAAEFDQIEAVEKMLRLRRDFVTLLRNFVSFADFYRTRLGAFQVGTLYIDGRSCDLCLSVHDVARHATLAGLAQAYLVYCECQRRKDAEKQIIVAAVTAGDVDNLMVGRNGVFYDRAGDDWDATITRIVENPISIRQAFWAPYKRFVRFIEEQLAKRANEADEQSKKTMDATVADGAKKPEPKEDEESKIDIGTVAAIGVAVGGIATFATSIIAMFFGLGFWMPFGLVALMLAISGPSMLIAWLKLRQRNIGPILDANGWAVNAFARINIPFGGALTAVAMLPPGATRALEDPFADKKRPWTFYTVLAVLAVIGLTWFFGKLDPYMPRKIQVATVLHRTPPVASATPGAPAASTPPAAPAPAPSK